MKFDNELQEEVVRHFQNEFGYTTLFMTSCIIMISGNDTIDDLPTIEIIRIEGESVKVCFKYLNPYEFTFKIGFLGKVNSLEEVITIYNNVVKHKS